ncbi:MAG: rod shape-determining protein MreC [Thermodesulfovibrionales bacterium]
MPLRRIFPLLLLLALSLTLMTYQSNKGSISPLRFLGSPFNHLSSILHSISISIKEPFRKITVRDEENTRLREEINRLLLEQQKYREIFFENQRLREALSLRERERRYVTTARVISRGPDRWSDTVVIDKGRRDSISKDMAVITPRGLVGKVSLVDDSYAYVLLVTDINFSAAVKVQETRRDAILSGAGIGRCILKYIPQEEAVKKGEVIVTSGFDDLFPHDLVVGYVSKVSRDTGIFQHIEVTPFQDMAKLDEVVIVRR